MVTVPPEEATTELPLGIPQSTPLWLLDAPLVGEVLLPNRDVKRPPEIGLIKVGGIFVPLSTIFGTASIKTSSLTISLLISLSLR